MLSSSGERINSRRNSKVGSQRQSAWRLPEEVRDEVLVVNHSVLLSLAGAV